ncbi:unnamed protein product, partial [Amoebophrya sp. A25]
AVEGIDFEIQEGELFCLLGHNGAGKSTTIQVLSGLLEPSAGSVSIFGRHIFKNRRSRIGLCPQNNLLFDDLTVREALTVCFELRNWQIQMVDDVLAPGDYVNDKKSKLCGQLSGGWKRKLCCVIAFCGNPELVILDEPTSGMDPANRRATWDFLLRRKRKSLKNSCSILLTTHHMDEADVLSDRICILKDGAVECLGTTRFLKEKYDCGYELTVIL